MENMLQLLDDYMRHTQIEDLERIKLEIREKGLYNEGIEKIIDEHIAVLVKNE